MSGLRAILLLLGLGPLYACGDKGSDTNGGSTGGEGGWDDGSDGGSDTASDGGEGADGGDTGSDGADGTDGTDGTDGGSGTDEDGDGYNSEVDCDDSNPAIHPEADELCNGVDDNCDSEVDNDAVDAATWYSDADRDGYGSGDGFTSCETPPDSTTTGGDCDDSNDVIYPGAPEEDCADPADYNCDGSTGYADEDGDGWAACSECNDADAAIYPEAAEVAGDSVDQNCDGVEECYVDSDDDGYLDGLGLLSSSEDTDCEDEGEGLLADPTGDCDDESASVNPGADELCDGMDNDCDSAADESGALDEGAWYMDMDGDGYGDATMGLLACEAPEGYVIDGSDCEDTDAYTYPGAAEAQSSSECMTDADEDGYGDSAPLSSGAVAGDDCDDSEAATNPAAEEYCDEIDQDCNGDAADSYSVDATTWYVDDDLDGYGDELLSEIQCEAPDGYVADGTDCDDFGEYGAWTFPGSAEYDSGTACMKDADDDGWGDADPDAGISSGTDCDDLQGAINPDADEYCDGVDNNCDGSSDEDEALDATAWYRDQDSDSYGGLVTTNACEQPSGYVSTSGDCRDSGTGADSTFPGAAPLDSATACMTDIDGDDWGEATAALGVTDGTDCDDANDTEYPGADEYCDGDDDDCDGLADESDALDASTWYADQDGDSYGDPDTSTLACDAPEDHVAIADDCEPTESSVNPGGTEVCNNGFDDDCDGTPNDCVLDDQAVTSADAMWSGENSSDKLGRSAAFAGDVNGDGEQDLILGAAAQGTGSFSRPGSAYVVYGPFSGSESVSTADVQLQGSLNGDQAGYSVAGVGDWDGDGFDDVAVGAYAIDSSASNGGGVFLMYGAPTQGRLSTVSDLSWTGSVASGYVGISLQDAGDLDGDGLVDMVAGASGNSASQTGTAYIISNGSAGGSLASASGVYTLSGLAVGDSTARAVAAGGDFNGDGAEDLLVSAHGADGSVSNAGAVYVVEGPIDGSTSLSGAARLLGANTNDAFGFSLDVLGDQDGDGYDDVLVGAPESDEGGTNGVGRAYVFAGPFDADQSTSEAVANIRGTYGGDSVGDAISGGGDVNGDGVPDLMVGAPDANLGASDNGGAWLFLGPVVGSWTVNDASTAFTGGAASDGAGLSVGLGGDVDGDGYGDILIGAAGYNDGTAGADAGATYLFFGVGN